MFEQPFVLDEEKVKWMHYRKNRLHFNHPFAVQDSTEIWNQLRQDMHQTIGFMESCNDEELSLLVEEIGDIMQQMYAGL